MQTQIDPNLYIREPKYGEGVSIPVNGVAHPGISVGGGNVIHNSLRRGGVCIDSLADFRDGRELSYNGFSGSLSPEQVVRNAHDALGKDYDFFFYNCKDFVRDMRGQSHWSLLIKTVVVGGTLYAGYKFAQRA